MRTIVNASFEVSASQRGWNRSVSGLGRDDRSLVIAPKVLTRRFQRWRGRYDEHIVSKIMTGAVKADQSVL